MSSQIVWAVVTIIALVLGSATAMAIAGLIAGDAVLNLVVILVVPSVTSLFALVQLQGLRKDVNVVKEQTNGNISRLIEKLPPSERE